jgi:hypothetical protein
MTQYAAIIDDGVPDDLGQSGVGLISDDSTETVYQFTWRLVNGRLIIEIGQRVEGQVVALLRGEGREHA